MYVTKKCPLPVFLMITLVGFCLLFVASCDGPAKTTMKGVYYAYSEEDGLFSEEEWVQLGDGEWNDSEGRKGSYEFSGEAIVLLTVNAEEEEVKFASGSVSGGELKFEMRGEEKVYRRSD